MVIWWRQMITKVRKKIYILLAEKLHWKKVTQNVVKRLPQIVHYCSAVGGKGEGSFLLCDSLVGEMGGAKNKMASPHCFLSSHSHLSQVFRLGVKHFGSASSKRWELYQLIVMTPTSLSNATHIFQCNLILCSMSIQIACHLFCF
jgi:hypothetical protein